MLEADLADGDLTQITSAITQAMKQGQPGVRQLTTHSTGTGSIREPLPAANGTAPEINDVDDNAEVEVNANDGESAIAPKGRVPRRLPTPKVLSDVDLNSGDVPFEEFSKEKGPKAALGRYLVVAYWFKTYRQVDAVNSNHVYTCYKKMGWGTDIKDFAQPLRDNARQGRGEMKKGAFVINHIGEDIVEKMTPE
ncbi:hypothetical protein W02_40390 [Nitrospira sp. KM1]|uniref:hypothetical protein n=1 Tax=Nitrospira sp. KM1 TaxID=1936990 RepID=UPI0013A71240|nr:hypothetical protein [Nitrospira sp. KM1]BCA56899.1 hypothetical protein W02_40390 [Nitrospira sp. KM1]